MVEKATNHIYYITITYITVQEINKVSRDLQIYKWLICSDATKIALEPLNFEHSCGSGTSEHVG